MAARKQKWQWSTLWSRWESKSVTTHDLAGLLVRVMVPLLLPALVPFLLTSEGALSEWATQTALFWIAPLASLACCLLCCWIKPLSRHFVGKLCTGIVSVLVGLAIAYASVGYFDLANALTGSYRPVYVSGPVIGKTDASAALVPRRYLHVVYEGREVNLHVPPTAYRSFSLGQRYGQTMYPGGFGYFYRWNFGSHSAETAPAGSGG
ncbi:hypothetical protein [Geomonas limicola]|nr:hypothetical protein [Geomonas limicola]